MAQSTFSRRLEEIAAALRQAGLRPVPTGPGSLRSIAELEVRVAALEKTIEEAIEDISTTLELVESRLFPGKATFRKQRDARLGSSLTSLPRGPLTAPPVVSQTGQLPNVQGFRTAPPQASIPVPTPNAPGPAQPSHQFAPASAGVRPPLSSADFPPGVPASVLAAATGKAVPAEELPQVDTVDLGPPPAVGRAPIPVARPPMTITPSIARAMAAAQAAEDAAELEAAQAEEAAALEAVQAMQEEGESDLAEGSVETTAEPAPEGSQAPAEGDKRDTEPPPTERPSSAP
jgi:hypothetical protein